MFLFKKIIAPFFFPMPLCLGISIVGLFLLWLTSKQRIGKILVSIGIGGLYLLSCGPVSDIILNPLEKQYSPYSVESSSKFIVVLGGGFNSDPQLPLTSRIDDNSLVRLIEGIRIYRKISGMKIVVSGQYISLVMAEVAKAIGVPEDDIIIESKSKDTKDEAKIIKSIVNNEPFILVTSAWHMPRSMAMFKKLGMSPIPAPTGHLVRRRFLSPSSFFPRSRDLYKSERAFHEYLGLVWAKVRGQI